MLRVAQVSYLGWDEQAMIKITPTSWYNEIIQSENSIWK